MQVTFEIMVSRDELKQLRKTANALEPVIRLGKNGVNDNIINEIDILLKKREMIKIKMLGSFIDQFDDEKTAHDIASRTKSHIVLKTGYVFVLFRKSNLVSKIKNNKR